MKKQTLLLTIFLTTNAVIAHDHPNLRYHKTVDTLETIGHLIQNEQKGIYFRFGDGEIGTAVSGSGSLEQHPSQSLKQEMIEAFALNGPTILKSLALHCDEFGGFEEGMFYGYHWWFATAEENYALCRQILATVQPFWGAEITDVYAQVAPHFAAVHFPDDLVKLLKIIQSKRCFVVGNQNIPAHVRTALFGNHCGFIPTPARDAYNSLNSIEQKCLQHINASKDFCVVILALGPAANALQKRLWAQCDNVFLFDVGSLIDAMAGWGSRQWITLVPFNRDLIFQKLRQ